jgi:hypothetical protein
MAMNTFRLAVRSSDAPIAWEGVREVVPVIDGRDLTDMIHEYERRFQGPTGYGGILIGGFYLGAGSLLDYFMGRRDSPVRESGTIAALGCSCGDVECWPLYTKVDADDARVRWSSFRQPYERERDYGGSGPFVFDRGEYERALEDATARLG